MVEVPDLTQCIDQHPLVADMPQRYRELLRGCASMQQVAAGQDVIRRDQPADKFYLIQSGMLAIHVRTPSGTPLLVQTVADGEVLGWSWLVPPHVWTFDAKATTDSQLIALDAACLRGKMDADPGLAHELLKRFVGVMAQRLEHARVQMLDLDAPPQSPPMLGSHRAMSIADRQHRFHDAS